MVVVQKCDSKTLHVELMPALEKVRIKLALAIAAANKSTPPTQRLRYLQTAERLVQLKRKLRKSEGNMAMSVNGRAQALELLGRVASGDDAQPVFSARETHMRDSAAARLCRILDIVVAELDR